VLRSPQIISPFQSFLGIVLLGLNVCNSLKCVRTIKLSWDPPGRYECSQHIADLRVCLGDMTQAEAINSQFHGLLEQRLTGLAP
jgi:hypothetical protein